MTIYIIICIWLFALSMADCYYRFQAKDKFFLYVLTAFGFWLMSFLRWDVGTDWESYFRFFDRHNTWDDFQSGSFEIGFTVINFGIKQITANYTIMLLVISCIIFPLKYSTIWKYSPYPFFSLTLYLLLSRADVFFVRETIALSIAFFSIRYIVNRKVVPFFVCILIAFLFHSSIAIFSFAYYFYSAPLSRRNIILILIGVLVFSLASSAMLMGVGDVLGGVFAWKINNYLEYAQEGENFGTGLSVQETLIRGGINRLFFLLLFIYLYIKNKSNDLLTGLIKLYMFNFLLFLMLVPVAFGLVRLVNGYEQVSILIVGIGLSTFSRKNRFVIVLVLSLYIFLRFYIGTLNGGYAHCFVPFKTIFD
ncbi:EpsG family protein [uncultured Bacteroides sp.]|uniref:EpsG family protein n=1 Tax=uncultured Bacteroides sp. TaxID=162156 RepID=UPI0025871673|nr:EpsG family protein [uncultured Bacteroides sp.]